MIDYVCTSCHKVVGRDNLTVKKSVFLEMGEGARTIRSRVVGWLCNACLQTDPEFNLEPFATQKVALNG